MHHGSQHHSSKAVVATAALCVKLRWDFNSRLLPVAAHTWQNEDGQRQQHILQRKDSAQAQTALLAPAGAQHWELRLPRTL